MNLTGKVELYGMAPEFERAVVLLACSSPIFFERVGEYLEPDALSTPAAALAVKTAQAMARDLGRGPVDAGLVMQALHRRCAEGKVTRAEIADVGALLIDAPSIDLEQVVSELAPVLKRRMQSQAVILSHDEYAKKGDFVRIQRMLDRAKSIGVATVHTELAPLVRRAVDVTPEQVEWLWGGFIPLGKVTLCDGDPGLGKSTMLSADIAARVSTGSPMPGGVDTRDPASVVLLSAEDGAADTIRPRLEAAGADLVRVHIVDPGMLTIPEGLPKLEEIVSKEKATLVVLDPLMAFLGERTDAHKDQDVRRAMRQLAAFAERTGAAVVCVRHLNKVGGTRAIYRGGGSIGISAAARSVLLVAKDPEDDELRVVASVKSNLGPPPKAQTYRIASDGVYGCGRIVWVGESSLSADALTSSLALADPEQTSALGEATRVLKDLLAGGPREATEVKADAKAAGVTDATLRRAKDRLGVRATKSTGPAGSWQWSLPQQGAQGVQDAQDAQDVQAPAQEHLAHERPSAAPTEQDAHASADERLEHLEHLEHLPGDTEPRWLGPFQRPDTPALTCLLTGDETPVGPRHLVPRCLCRRAHAA